jgi:OOP family OmpA-OmpF porin
MVTLQLHNGVLSATGTAPPAWIVMARQQAGLIPGITQFQEDGLIDTDVQQLEAIKTLLIPPKTVTLRLADGVVYAAGTAPRAWTVEARQRMQDVAQTVLYCDDQLNDSVEQRFTLLKERLQTTVLHFLSHTVQLAPMQAEKFAQLVVDIQALYEVAQVLDKCLCITVVGHADREGVETVNRCLSQRRAEYIRTLLSEHGVAAPSLSAVGVGTKAPLRMGRTAEAQTFNQGVSFWVVVSNELR